MNSKLRDILNGIADIGRGWVHDQLDGTSFIKDALDGIDKEVAEAEKAIRQAVGEEMLELVGDEEDDRLKFSPEWRAGNNAKLYELRQKIKEWSQS